MAEIGEILEKGREPTQPQPRDEGGRYASKSLEAKEAKQAEAKQEAPPAKPAEPVEQKQQPDQVQPQEPQGEAPPSPDLDTSDPKNWSYAAYKDEKAKRQEAEQRRAEAEHRAELIQRQFQTVQAQIARMQQPEPTPDPFENPQGYQQALRSEMEKEIKAVRLESSLQLAQIRHGDTFDTAYREFLNAATAGDKAAYLSVMSSPNQGEAIVRWWQQNQVSQTVGSDPTKWMEEQRAKIREELRAEMNGGAPPVQQTGQMPSNLAGVRNVGPRTGPPWSGPAPIGDIFARKRATK